MISYLSVALKASISKRTSTIQIFLIVNMYFCVAIAIKNAIKVGGGGGGVVSVLISFQNDQKKDNFGFK